jgi:hypothetical protein
MSSSAQASPSRGKVEKLSSATVTTAGETSLSGYIDSIVEHEAKGWAKASVGTVVVRIYQNGKEIAQGQPSLPRADLGGNYGFRIKLPASVDANDLLAGTLTIFLESKDGKTKTPIGVNGDLLSDLVIAGFTKHLTTLKPHKLHDVFFKIHERFCGLKEDEERARHNAHLLDYTKQVLGGFLEAVDNDTLTGWARGIGAPAMVKVYKSNTQIAAVTPDIQRDDVGGLHGFRLQIVEPDLKANVASGTIRIYVETLDGLHRNPIHFRRDLFAEKAGT